MRIKFVGFPASPPDKSIPVRDEEDHKHPHESLPNVSAASGLEALLH